MGVTDEQIRALTFYQRSPLFDERDLKKHFNEEQIVELTLVIAIANFTNRFNDALRMEPDIG